MMTVVVIFDVLQACTSMWAMGSVCRETVLHTAKEEALFDAHPQRNRLTRSSGTFGVSKCSIIDYDFIKFPECIFLSRSRLAGGELDKSGMSGPINVAETKRCCLMTYNTALPHP